MKKLLLIAFSAVLLFFAFTAFALNPTRQEFGGTATSTIFGAGNLLIQGTNSYSSIATSTAASYLGLQPAGSYITATTTITTNILSNGPNFTFATGSVPGLNFLITGSGSTITFAPAYGTGYSIPLNASSTNWNNLFNTLNGLTLPVSIANGGTGSSTQIFITSVTGSGNISSSGGLTPNITITNSPTFTGTLTVNGTSTLATTTIANLTVTQPINGSFINAVTFNNSGSGASSGQTYNGSSASTISYNTIGAQVAGTYVTGITCSGSILPCTGTSPTIQLQNLTTNDILFGQGNNIIATSSNFTWNGGTLAVTGSTTISQLLTVGTNLTVTGTSTLATTTDSGTLSVTGNVTIGTSGVSTTTDVTYGNYSSFAQASTTVSTAAYTINLANGNVQTFTLATTTTFTINGIVSGLRGILNLQQDNSGSRTVTWPSSFHWSAATAPTLTTTANKVDVISYECYSTNVCFAESALNFSP